MLIHFSYFGKSMKKHEAQCHNLHADLEEIDSIQGKESDDVLNYQCNLLNHGLLYANFRDAISEGDGEELYDAGNSCCFISMLMETVAPSMLLKLCFCNFSSKHSYHQDKHTYRSGIEVLIVILLLERMSHSTWTLNMITIT